MKHLKILGIMLIAYTLNSCDFLKAINQNPAADLTKLPPETQEGKNTFGCLVNGKVWRNQGTISLYSTNLEASKTQNVTIIAYKRVDNIYESISLAIIADRVGKYKLDYVNAGLFRNMASTCNEGGHTPLSGDLEITKYQVTEINGGRRLIVAGRFNFLTLAYPCGDTIRVTNGRFDILL
jgi:hypothetical protein